MLAELGQVTRRTLLASGLFVALASLAQADTKTWTGGVNALWSNPGNWAGGVPLAGDRLVFPVSASNATNTNDLPAGTVFYDITFLGSNYLLGGNDLGLTNGINASQTPNTLSMNIDAVGSQSWNGSSCCGTLTLTGSVDLGANNLTLHNQVTVTGTISGAGGVTLGSFAYLTAANTYVGQTSVTGYAQIDGAQPGSAVLLGGFSGSFVSGIGKVGPVTIGNGNGIQPGAGYGSLPGTFYTGDLAFGTNTYCTAQLNGTSAGVAHDVLDVAGTVTIDPSASLLPNLGYAPLLGDTYVVIRNDDSDPITGTFAGLPEGAMITLNASEFQISYQGGDGNDLTLTVTAAAKTWTGAVNTRWSVAGNWLGGVPSPGDPLVFPSGASNLTNFNDLPSGQVYKLILFSGAGYDLTGNQFGLTDGITSQVGSNTISAPLDVAATQSFSGSSCCGPLQLNAKVDLGSNTLSLHNQVTVNGQVVGSGDLVLGGYVVLMANNTYTGSTTVSGFGEINGLQTQSPVSTSWISGVAVSGTGKLGTLTIASNHGLTPGQGFGNLIGRLSCLDLSTSPGSYAQFSLNGVVPATGYDQVAVTGPVTIDPTAVLLTNLGYAPSVGDQFVILDNDNADPIVGTFSGLPEGANLTLNGSQLQISYVGGTGNDVVLTVIVAAKTWSGAVDNLWSNPGNWQGGVPNAGDPLVFPSGAANLSNINDLTPGFAPGPILITGANYVLSGFPLVVDSGVSCNLGPATLNMDLKCNAPQTFTAGSCCGPLYLNGNIDLSSHTITFGQQVEVAGTIGGTGSVVLGSLVRFSGPNTYTGSTSINQYGQIDGIQPASAIVTGGFGGAQVSGTGRVGSITLSNSGILQPGPAFGNLPGKLTSSDLDLASGSLYYASLNGSVPGVGYDQVSVNGTVTIAPTSAFYASLAFTPAQGQIFVVLLNDGADAVNGFFNGMPQDTIFNIGPYPFKISYIGKTGNDITLTSLSGDPFNNAPIAVDDAYNTPQNTTLNVAAPGVLQNDSDPDLHSLSVVLFDATSAAGGSVAVGVNGSLTYVPPTGFTGTDTFNYIITDGLDATDLATVTITVGPNPAEVSPNEIPRDFALHLPSPNPSRGLVEVTLALPTAGRVRGELFDAGGRLVAVLADDQPFLPGIHRLAWDGRDGSGSDAASGVYFVRVSSGSHRAVRKLIRLTP
ncbi:MAG: cadherin-like domain-containing protein [Candidatus Eisenbacteria bacterium]|nr:cadherin-like domain-containing protein [Candidatus Eisenbacteria bacterium]